MKAHFCTEVLTEKKTFKWKHKNSFLQNYVLREFDSDFFKVVFENGINFAATLLRR